jgi:DNA-binding beta-propeller fold protein YncE
MICIDPQGLNLFVSDPKNGAFGNKIRQIVIATQQVITISGSGAVGTNNSTGLLSTYTSPYGLAMNRTGTAIYIADGGKVLRQLTL